MNWNSTNELSKELKEAGFPQDCRESWFYHSGNGDGTKKWDINMTNGLVALRLSHPNSLVASPTLSELIEACGEDFEVLYRGIGGEHYPEQEGKWFCNPTMNEGNHSIYDWQSEGSTPEEAVARLWLALNKK